MSQQDNLNATNDTLTSTPPPAPTPGTLETFFLSSSRKPPPTPIATSQEIRDRGSTFVGTIYAVTTPEDAHARIQHVKHVVHGSKKASHEIAAWRCMVLKHGKDGLGGPEDFEVKSGFKDDGERWAGERVLKVMQGMAVIDAVVIVSRWYGGTLLGPARFTHVETCAAEVCREFKRSEELRDCISTLREMDDLVARMRSELADTNTGATLVKGSNMAGGGLSNDHSADTNSAAIIVDSGNDASSSSTSAPITVDSKTAFTTSATIEIVVPPIKKSDYSGLDVPRAKKLIRARESAMKSLKALIAKRRREHISSMDQTPNQAQTLPLLDG
ncbi:hypothetical protein AX16_003978 [Volvariella volvacea WC 439]|nr:hypothetical protein AX16_003978 [Volvariella volvacea WC 439]